jgi:hypothetical protein
LRSN